MLEVKNGFRRKIKLLEELIEIVKALKSENKTIVHCHGDFDLFHRGHLHQFEQAKTQGDILVVSITTDRYVVKGPDRPVFNQNIRAEVIASLEVVDFVVLSDGPNSVELIKSLKPNVYVKGASCIETAKNPLSGFSLEKKAMEDLGSQVFYSHEMPIHASPLLNSYIDPYPEDVLFYLDSFKKKHPFSSFVDMINRFQDLKVLLVGETIIDQYDYVEAMDMSPKGGIMATRHLSSESFAGGILACANHMATFCSTVDVVSSLGARNSYKDFVCRSLAENVKSWFLIREGLDTLVKRRQVENNYFKKQSETYYGDESQLRKKEEDNLLGHLRAVIDDYDLVFVVDYGHGLITPRIINFISDKSHKPELAVNVQVNSANKGFHLITRYPFADFVSLTQYEARIAFCDKESSPQELAKKLMAKLGASAVAISLGRKGSVVSDKNNCHSTPGFSKRIVDTVGAGDAFFSLAALSYTSNFDIELTGFIGNLAGALSTTYIGNKSSVTKSMFLNFAQTLLS